MLTTELHDQFLESILNRLLFFFTYNEREFTENDLSFFATSTARDLNITAINADGTIVANDDICGMNIWSLFKYHNIPFRIITQLHDELFTEYAQDDWPFATCDLVPVSTVNLDYFGVEEITCLGCTLTPVKINDKYYWFAKNILGESFKGHQRVYPLFSADVIERLYTVNDPADHKQETIDFDLLGIIAKHIKDNVRELE